MGAPWRRSMTHGSLTSEPVLITVLTAMALYASGNDSVSEGPATVARLALGQDSMVARAQGRAHREQRALTLSSVLGTASFCSSSAQDAVPSIFMVGLITSLMFAGKDFTVSQVIVNPVKSTGRSTLHTAPRTQGFSAPSTYSYLAHSTQGNSSLRTQGYSAPSTQGTQHTAPWVTHHPEPRVTQQTAPRVTQHIAPRVTQHTAPMVLWVSNSQRQEHRS